MSLQTERALFEACMDLPTQDREGWLASRCDDPALRERVLRLLRIHDSAQASGAFEKSPAGAARPAAGQFQLIEPIGEGAMGEVWLAEQTAPVRRRVAVKIVKSGMGSREVLARFELERQTLAMMSHPCIAHIIDAGTTDDARPYFAMEYVPGIPLTKYCDQHRLAIDARLALFIRICEAVQHAHQKGVIHRDLKPGNLLVTEIDGQPAPKVIDFGIAKAVALEQAPSRAHTMIGHLIGTPEYMSPEQAQLSPLDVDTRADVYSLGVVLHELLTGALPFKSSDPNATPAALVQELLTHDPAAPSARIRVAAPEPAISAENRGLTTRQLAARLSGDLDWIVLKALEKDRNRRYGSPAELAADIRRHIANEPVVAGPPSTFYRMRKFAARHRIGLTLVAGAFTASIVFGALMAYQAHQIGLQRDEARFQAQRAEASNEFMSVMLEEVGPGGRPLTPLELVDTGVQLLDARYGADPQFAARMLLQMSRRYMDLNNTERQTQVLSRALALAREIDDPDLIADIECTFVRSELDATRHAGAAEHMASARTTLQRASTLSVATRVDCLRAEADTAEVGRDFATAADNLQRAQRILEENGATRGLLYHAVLTDLGGIYFRTSRFREALALNELTAQALDRNGRGGTMGRVTVAVNRASNLYRLGEILEAEKAGLEALRRAQRMRADAPVNPAHTISYAITLNRLGRADEARERLTAANEEARALGNGYLETVSKYQLGRSLLLSGQPGEARTLLDQVRAFWSENATANKDRIGDLDRSLAELDLLEGRNQDAKTHIESAMHQFGYPSENVPIGIAATVITAARVELALGKYKQAEAYARDALRISESIARDRERSADVGEARLVLASIHNAQHQQGSQGDAERAGEALAASLGADHALTREALSLARGDRE